MIALFFLQGAKGEQGEKGKDGRPGLQVKYMKGLELVVNGLFKETRFRKVSEPEAADVLALLNLPFT